MLTTFLDLYMISIYISEAGPPQIEIYIDSPVDVIGAQIHAQRHLMMFSNGMTLEILILCCGRYSIIIGTVQFEHAMPHALPPTQTWVAIVKDYA